MLFLSSAQLRGLQQPVASEFVLKETRIIQGRRAWITLSLFSRFITITSGSEGPSDIRRSCRGSWWISFICTNSHGAYLVLHPFSSGSLKCLLKLNKKFFFPNK